VSHEEALDWADEQYSGFSERRRLEAESEGAARYIDDLTATATLLEGGSRPAKPRGKKERM